MASEIFVHVCHILKRAKTCLVPSQNYKYFIEEKNQEFFSHPSKSVENLSHVPSTLPHVSPTLPQLPLSNTCMPVASIS